MTKQRPREGPEGSGLQCSTELPVHVLSFVLARPPVSPALKKSGRGCGFVNPGIRDCGLISKQSQDPYSGCTLGLEKETGSSKDLPELPSVGAVLEVGVVVLVSKLEW